MSDRTIEKDRSKPTAQPGRKRYTKVKRGYKQTEVGVIPVDWEVVRVGEIATTVASGHSHVDFDFGGFPVYGSTGIIGRCGNSDYSGQAILIARVGANAGKITVVDGEYGVTDNTIIVKINSLYPLEICWRQLETIRLNSLTFGSGQPLITGTQIKGIVIPLPPTLAEQNAIAEVLGDVDALIEALEQLLAKKRLIKGGAMQELLTGQRRLPGFEVKPGFKQTEVGVIPEDWEVEQLGNIAPIATGSTPPTRNAENYGNEFLFVSPTDMGASKYISRTEKMLSKKGFSISRLFPKNSILFVCIGSTIGKCGIAAETLTTNQQINVIIPTEEKSMECLFYAISTIASKIRSRASEQAVPIVNKATFADTAIPFPPTKAEQTAIAAILSDMDAEIAALEQKLDKTHKLKQGMMQELLTGRIRLI